MAIVYLALGTNLGDREANLRRGLQALAQQVLILRVSSIYETEPWGYKNQPWFLNLVLRAQTLFSPHDLLVFCKHMEEAVGRQPTFQYGPRKLDIDILSFDDQVLQTPDLVLPHPRIEERIFVLVPFVEIAPQWVHPVLHKSIHQLLAETKSEEAIRLWSPPLELGGE